MPSSEDILALGRDQIAKFIQDQASAKTLTDLIKRLNEDLIAGDAAARDLASRALRHLGFVEYA